MVLVEADVRTHRGEVGEHLGVDLGEGVGAPRLDHRADGGRCGVSGIVPAGEGSHHDGTVQCRLGEPTNVLCPHADHATVTLR